MDHPFFSGGVEVEDVFGFLDICFGLDFDALEEELAPAGPVEVARDGEEAFVVFFAVGFEAFAEIEGGAAENVSFVEEKREEHSAYAAVAVGEGMERFEFGMHYGKLDEDV